MVDTQPTDIQYSHKETTHTPDNNPAIRKATQQFQTNISDAAMEDWYFRNLPIEDLFMGPCLNFNWSKIHVILKV